MSAFESRVCSATGPLGQGCRARPLHGRALCYFHDPEEAEKVAAARRLGGARRRHEGAQHLAFDLGDLGTVEGLRRLLEIAVADGLALEPGVGRLRVILAATEQARRLLETADLVVRVEMLEAVARREQPAPPTTKYPEGLLLESDR